MTTTELYNQDNLTILFRGQSISFGGERGARLPSVALPLTLEPLSQRMVQACKQAGKDPASRLAIRMPGGMQVVLPQECEEALKLANWLAAELKAEQERVANLPSNRAMADVQALYAEANRLNAQGGVGSYYAKLAEADAAMAAWRAAYPREALLMDAAELEAEAAGIQDSYSDLDGSLSREMVDKANADRQVRREDLKAQAQHLRAQAGATEGAHGV